jgi:hypothetical protein
MNESVTESVNQQLFCQAAGIQVRRKEKTVWRSFYAPQAKSFVFRIFHSVRCISVITVTTTNALSFSTVTHNYNTPAPTFFGPNCSMIREHKIEWKKRFLYNCVLSDDGPDGARNLYELVRRNIEILINLSTFVVSHCHGF